MKHLFSLVLLLFFFPASYSQKAVYSVINYTTKDYGRDFHPSNMALLQDDRGLIYSANGFKLLEYDGSVWKSYPSARETWILSLASDDEGNVYAGSQNEFGFFAPDSRGELKYHSLTDSVAQDDLDFTNVWKVHRISDGVFFQSEEKIFHLKDGKIKVIRPETSFHTSFAVDDRLFVRARGRGLLEWNGNEFIKLNDSRLFDTTGVFFMLPFGKDGKDILIGTQEKGLWILKSEAGSGQYIKFSVEDEALLRKSVITGATLTGDGSIAIGTMLNGVIIINRDGKTKAVINTGNGANRRTHGNT